MQNPELPKEFINWVHYMDSMCEHKNPLSDQIKEGVLVEELGACLFFRLSAHSGCCA